MRGDAARLLRELPRRTRRGRYLLSAARASGFCLVLLGLAGLFVGLWLALFGAAFDKVEFPLWPFGATVLVGASSWILSEHTIWKRGRLGDLTDCLLKGLRKGRAAKVRKASECIAGSVNVAVGSQNVQQQSDVKMIKASKSIGVGANIAIGSKNVVQVQDLTMKKTSRSIGVSGNFVLDSKNTGQQSELKMTKASKSIAVSANVILP